MTREEYVRDRFLKNIEAIRIFCEKHHRRPSKTLNEKINGVNCLAAYKRHKDTKECKEIPFIDEYITGDRTVVYDFDKNLKDLVEFIKEHGVLPRNGAFPRLQTFYGKHKKDQRVIEAIKDIPRKKPNDSANSKNNPNKIKKYRNLFKKFSEFFERNKTFTGFPDKNLYKNLLYVRLCVLKQNDYYKNFLKDIIEEFPIIKNNINFETLVSFDKRVSEFLQYCHEVKHLPSPRCKKGKKIYEYFKSYRIKFSKQLKRFENEYSIVLKHPETIAFFFENNGTVTLPDGNTLPNDKLSLVLEWADLHTSYNKRTRKHSTNKKEKVLVEKKRTKNVKKRLKDLPDCYKTDEELRSEILSSHKTKSNNKTTSVKNQRNTTYYKNKIRESFERVTNVCDNIYHYDNNEIKACREIVSNIRRRYITDDPRMEEYINEVLEDFPNITKMVHTGDYEPLILVKNERKKSFNAEYNKIYRGLIEKYTMFEWANYGKSSHQLLMVPDLDLDKDSLYTIFQYMDEGLDDETIDDIVFLQGPEVVSVIRELMKIENNPFCLAYSLYLEEKMNPVVH